MADAPGPTPPFRWPAEWEPHRRTWIAWPHHRRDWPGKFPAIPWIYADITRHLALSEEVGILVNNAATETQVRSILNQAGVDLSVISFFHVPTDRVWTRDTGPIFVKDSHGRETALHFRFNGWAKYRNYKKDEHVPELLGKLAGFEPLQPRCGTERVVLEGGSIDGNGHGLLLTTEECLLSKKKQRRNPRMEREDYERVFADCLGTIKTLWLDRGIAGDDTHGHIDDLARFAGPGIVTAVEEKNPADVNYEPLQGNLERLRGMTDATGSALQVVPLPMPDPLFFAGQRLPASYANFYIANSRVLVPTFHAPQDRIALGIISELFPGRTVVGIHAVDLVWGFGTLHCLTQQQPA